MPKITMVENRDCRFAYWQINLNLQSKNKLLLPLYKINHWYPLHNGQVLIENVKSQSNTLNVFT